MTDSELKKEALFYERRESNNSVKCLLCPVGCEISPGKTGVCHARRNDGGALIAESYGRVTSIALDPVEKKPFYYFHPGSRILSLGSYGCNLSCGFCQNHEISTRTAPYEYTSPGAAAAAAKQLIPDGNIGLAYTYNEPLIGYEYLLDCAKEIKNLGMKNAVVTNGYINEKPLSGLLPYIDAWSIDLKGYSDEFYRSLGGRLAHVKRTIELAASAAHVELTTLIIPGENDSPEAMDAEAAWIAGLSPDIPLHISRYFPKHKYDKPATPIETLTRLKDVASARLRLVRLGNAAQ